MQEPLHLHGPFALAQSTRQPGMQQFGVPGLGEIAFHPPLWPLGSALVLGDPLCASEDRLPLLQAFLHEHPRAAFFQLDANSAACLRMLGFHSTPMGYESWIALPDWQLGGQSRRYLRNVLSRAARQGISLQEWPDYRARMPELQEISAQWLRLRRRDGRELHFLARPLDSCHDPATRCFVAVRNGEAIAFVMFDPLYEAGQVIGYAASLLRSCELGSAGWQDFIVLRAMEQFRSEALHWLTLGLSPFAPAQSSAVLDSSPATRMIFCLWSEYGNWLYNFRGVSFHKRFYPAQRRPAYFCSRSALPLMDLRDGLAAMNVNPMGRLNGYLHGRYAQLTG